MPTAPPTPDAPPRPAPPPDPLHELLNRPRAQRAKEYQYRFGQAAVFGLPVIALEIWGHALGGADSRRWVPLFQALLAGWAVYVGAAGMLAEGLVSPHRRTNPDLWIAGLVIAAYLLSLISYAFFLIRGQGLFGRPLFAPCVAVLIVWSLIQWLRHR